MQLKSVPIAALGLLATISASSLSSEHDRKEALSLLQQSRYPRRNHGTFEELKGDDYERECVQEICDREELDEIYPEDKVEADKKWATLVDQCHVTPCSAVGTAKCVQRWRARTCVCLGHVNGTETIEGVPRFTGPDCSDDVDECADKAVKTKCGEKTCINTIGSFKCGCDQGFEDVDGECVDVDECANDTDNCGDNASCVNQPGSHSCECDAGYNADPEDENRCINIDECEEEHICGFTGLSKSCVDSEGSYSCVCSESGYSADAEGDCVDINECETSCLGENENCTNLPGSHDCSCVAGYEMLARVCVDIDECGSGAADCGNCGCSNKAGSFECIDSSTHEFSFGVCTLKDACDNVNCGFDQECNGGDCVCTKGEGWHTVPVAGMCSDIDECENELACNDDEVCMNLPGSFECVAVPTVPQLAPSNQVFPSICPSGFEHDGVECVDIDECQDNNGGCPGMCINLYGDFICYESFDSERPLCHHFTNIDADIVPYGYECGCYEGYELCDDGFTCTCTGNQYIQKIDETLECGSCQFDYEGECFQQSEHEDTFASAEASCVSRGGSLAEINTRDAWWNIGSQVHKGRAAFWIGEHSDSEAANMYVVGTAGKLLANSPMNMAHVPPQWNKASADESHYFVCSFPSGQVAVDACASVLEETEDVNEVQEVTQEITTEVNTTEEITTTTEAITTVAATSEDATTEEATTEEETTEGATTEAATTEAATTEAATTEDVTTEGATTINFNNGHTTEYAETTEMFGSGDHK